MTAQPYSNNQVRSDGAIPVYQASSWWQSITTAGIYAIQTGTGSVDALIVGTTGMTITLYDNTSATGTPIITITPALGYTPIRVQYLAGLYAVVTGTGAITVTGR